VIDVLGRSQEEEGLGQTVAAFLFSAEQQHRVAPFLVFDVAKAGRRARRGRALRLPVKESIVDGVILVHRRRRVVHLRLLQGDEEYIGRKVREMEDPFAHSRSILACPSSLHISLGIEPVEDLLLEGVRSKLEQERLRV
jgi:hypothetical protein